MRADEGVVRGNFKAVSTLAIIIVLSLVLVFATMLIPSLPSLRHVELPTALLGSAYFLLIGLGFMFVEMGLIQRISVYLGHPIYGLAIGALRHYCVDRLRQPAVVACIPFDR